jgi:hypothetical protein
MEDRHPVRQLVLLLAVTGIAVWAEMPDWQRQMVAARVKSRARRMAGWLARRTGHRAMGDELAGHDDAAAAGYGFAYRLSVLRDRL